MKKKLQIICVGFITLNLQLITHNSFSQNVGINSDGSTPDVNTMLDVKSSGTDASTFGIKIKDFSGDNKFVVRSDGNVGIGTLTPTELLTVGSGADPAQRANTIIYGVNSGEAVIGARNATSNTEVGIGATTADGSWVGTVTNQNFNVVTNDTKVMTFTNTGNVGIGTITPVRRFVVSDNQPGITPTFLRLENTDTGSSSGATLDFFAGSTIAQIVGITVNASPKQGVLGFEVADGAGGMARVMTLDPNGLIGVGTAAPTVQFHTTGMVRFANYGAGTLQTDAFGNLSVSSDERLKNLQGTYNRGLKDLKGIQPISYRWKSTTGYDSLNVYFGFSAQNVQKSIPEAISKDQNGYLTISDRPIIAVLVNAINEQQKIIESQKEEIQVLKSNDIRTTQRLNLLEKYMETSSK